MKAVTDIRLLIGGEEFTGWTRWEVESCLLTPSDAFSLSAPNINGELAGKITAGSAAKLTLDGTVVMTGYVDEVNYSGGEVEVQGRDLFLFLVDCSARPGTHQKVTLLTLARRLTENWPIIWRLQSGITLATHNVKIEPGEAVWEVLAKVARLDGVLMWCNPDGTADISRLDYTQIPMHRLRRYLPSSGKSEENNIMGGSVSQSWRDRFSTVTQIGSTGNTANSYERNSHKRYAATDTGIGVYRPIILNDSNLRDITMCRNKAELEKARRLHDAEVLNYAASGHYGTPYHPAVSPVLYEPGVRVDVIDQDSGVADVYMLTTRRFSLDDEGGPVSELTLHPEGWMAAS